MVRTLKGLLSELTRGNMGAEIPTYVRSDNSDAAFHVESVNTGTREKRLNRSLESKREEIEKIDG